MIDELEALRDARPEVQAPTPEVRASARLALRRACAAEPTRRRPRWPRPIAARNLAPAAALLVVIAVALVFLGLQRKAPGSGSSATGTELVFKAEPTAQTPVVTRAAVARAVRLIRRRAGSLARGVQVSSAGHELIVRLGPHAGISRAELAAALATTAQLNFYDWEADALLPDGRTVASGLARGNPAALAISQGMANASPGAPGAGSMPLYEAVKVASEQPGSASRSNSRLGPEYFMFGAPGSAACSAAKADGAPASAGQHCYLAGPALSIEDLDSALPPGVSAGEGQALEVKQGIVVVPAVPRDPLRAVMSSDTQAFVLRDDPALTIDDITNPHQGTDQSGAPDIEFGFTPTGRADFQRLTAQVAHRGDLVSGLGQTLDQHFAIALNGYLLEVPSIDFKIYPDGVPGSEGAQLVGAFTVSSARELSALLRGGALPLKLVLISATTGAR